MKVIKKYDFILFFITNKKAKTRQSRETFRVDFTLASDTHKPNLGLVATRPSLGSLSSHSHRYPVNKPMDESNVSKLIHQCKANGES